MQFVMFAKHLQAWPLTKTAEVVKSLGFEGLDLTVRPGGYVLPEDVETALPAAFTVCAEAGLGVPMITTNLTRADDPGAEATLATAASLGIHEIKYGYHTYSQFGQFGPLVERARADLASLVPLAAKHGVRLNLHIHSANFVTASPFVVAQLLADHPPELVGAYLDLGHLVIEGGVDVWRQGLELLVGRAPLLAVKSLAWQRDPAVAGPSGWEWRVVPLEEGPVDWVKAWKYLAQGGFDGLVSVHSEYQGGHSFRNLSEDEVVAQTRRDFAYLLRCRELALVG